MCIESEGCFRGKEGEFEGETWHGSPSIAATIEADFAGKIRFAAKPHGASYCCRPMGKGARGARWCSPGPDFSGTIEQFNELVKTYGYQLGAAKRRSRLLEQSKNVVGTLGRRCVRLVPCRCGRHVCKGCGVLVGREVRRNITQRIEDLQKLHGTQGDVQLWTLTVDPGCEQFGGRRGADGELVRWADPRAVFDHVNAQRLIGEWARALGVRHYVVVVEWQKNGMPHWHLLVWAPVRSLFISHAKAQEAWPMGFVQFEAAGRGGRRLPVSKAVNYVTKYMTKPRESLPSWAMDLSGVKLVRSSKDFGAIRRGLEDAQESVEAAEEEGPATRSGRTPPRTNGVALAACRGACRLLYERVDHTSGEVTCGFMGSVRLSWRAARALAERCRGTVEAHSCRFAFDGPAIERFLAELARRRVVVLGRAP